jgi:hypothetical protein
LNCLLLPWGESEPLVRLRQSRGIGSFSFQHQDMPRR